MEIIDNTGLGLIKAAIERVQNRRSLFSSALKKLVNSSEKDLDDFLKMKVASMPDSILCLVPEAENLIIEALDGKDYFSDANNILNWHPSRSFRNLRIDHPGLATAETLVEVREMVKDANFAQIFTEITSDLDKLVLTQAQIIRFGEKYPLWLCQEEGRATFFLMKANCNYFVVTVEMCSGILKVDVDGFDNFNVWHARSRHRIVTPQLMSSAA